MSVVPVDPSGDRELHVRDRFVGAIVEHCRTDALGLVETVDRLHQGVIVCIADGANGGRDALKGELVGIGQGNILRDRVQMCSQLLGLDWVALPATFPEGHPQRDHDQLDMLAGLSMPGDDALRVDVEDERDVNSSGPGAAGGEGHHPGVIGPRRDEVPVQQIPGPDPVFCGDRGPDALVAANTAQSESPHRTINRTTRCPGDRGAVDRAIIFRLL